MDFSPAFLQEFHEIYSEISTRKAVFRTLNTLKDLREDAVYWVEGTITGVETNREFCYLACRICDKKVEEVGGRKRCLDCGEFTFRNKFRFNIELTVADESDSAKMILWNRASEKLIGEQAEDIIATYGDTARIMPDEIAEKILGREGLFEVIVSSQRLHDDSFTVSRLTVDDEIKDVYIVRNYPAAYESNPEDDSFLQTLDYVEMDDQEAESAMKNIASGTESETTRTPKRQKMERAD